jgi:hypothetical protein
MNGKNGTVLLIVSNLPDSLGRDDLEALFRPLCRSNWPALRVGFGGVGRCHILRITQHGTDQAEHHGLVAIQPATLALRAIRELSGTLFQGRVIQVRRYQARSPLRDRRRHVSLPADDERRGTERRRSHLNVEIAFGSKANRGLALLRGFLGRSEARSFWA